jgi:4'-phosphopantetheinyl transferase
VSAPLVLLAVARDLPRGDAWLGPDERASLLRLRAPKRRRDFRLGRFAARSVLALLEDRRDADARQRFEVRRDPGGAPRAFRDGVPLGVTLSITHSEGWAAASAQRGDGRLGCDLEHVEPRSRAFMEDYFTAAEHAFVATGPRSDRPLRATLIWSAKEAVMKALGLGLRLPPLAVEIAPIAGPASPAGWRRFSVSRPADAARLPGWWRSGGRFLLTVVGGAAEPRLVEPQPWRS